MRVVFFHRKPRPNHNFSVENLFRQIRESFDNEVNWRVKELSFFSSGFFQRLFIGLEAMFNQDQINHVTGDINFIAIFLRKRKTVLTILDVGFMNHPNKVARMLLRWFWIVLPVKRAGIVTTISQATKDEVLKYVNVDPKKIKVVYVPILNGFQPQPNSFNKTKPTILQIGTKANKNVDRLIEAVAGIPCTLDIVGELTPAMVERLKTLKIDYVNSYNISNEEVMEKYRKADIISFVSTYEGFGMPIVEANAMGRAVITSNVLSMPEVAGNAAHLVNPYEVTDIRKGILKLINDDNYRCDLIKNGFSNRMRFDSKQIARDYKAIYQQLLASA